MKLDEAMPLLSAACNKPFGVLFQNHPEDLRTNKGNVGQLLLRYVGLKLNSDLCDFEDGELKTNKALPNGMPIETMFIRQVSGIIDTMVGKPSVPFQQSCLYTKISNLVYLPVVKQSADASNWYFTKCVRVRITIGSPLYGKVKADYDAICAGLRQHIENSVDGFIHTTNGDHYIQVRSKDAKDRNTGEYHPIYSQTYGREVSNKNHAFYFMKPFMRDALAGRL